MRTEMVRAKKVAKALVLFGLVALSALQPQGGLWAADDYPRTAKYIFLFIGDGMGIPQRAAASAYTGKPLTVDTFPAQGVTTTAAADRFITDSAAAGTAMASGTKSRIGYLGVDPNLRPVKTLAEMAKEQGKKVGIVSSVSIDHATPAAFYAHVPSRSMYHEIGMALVKSDFDFFGGGGFKDPDGKKSKAPQGNVLEAARSAGYTLVDNKRDFMALKNSPGLKVIAINPWLQDSAAMPYEIDRRSEDISLAEFTEKAVELLDNPQGFFLMVEGGKIDWACHANDGVAAIRDTLALDEAVRVAFHFYEKHPQETLIVVTGDHECGGLTLGFAGTKYETEFNMLKHQKVSFQKFSDEVLKQFRQECGADCDFEKIKPVITANFGLKFTGDPQSDPLVLKPYQEAMLREAFERSMAAERIKADDPETYLLYGDYDPLTVTLTHVLNNNAGLGWTSFQHTGAPVTTSAVGVGAELFNGYYDNTDLAKKTMSVMGLTPQVVYMAEAA
ncbi:alkaline phosphatase [Desulfoglaeba alkanexedens]|nr:alkaline phosphatase [Desulfoglaeba alkanexedens]